MLLAFGISEIYRKHIDRHTFNKQSIVISTHPPVQCIVVSHRIQFARASVLDTGTEIEHEIVAAGLSRFYRLPPVRCRAVLSFRHCFAAEQMGEKTKTNEKIRLNSGRCSMKHKHNSVTA